MSDPLVTFLISTHNRRAALLKTLGILHDGAAGAAQSEIIIIDNASTDGAADAVATAFPNVRIFRQNHNGGACAKNIGISAARGRYVVFLDDDSFPAPGSIDRMVEHFDADARLGAAIFNITLPTGMRECSAYPDVFVGCGVGLRTDALRQVGGLPEDFFMQAEEYDLSLRLLDAGWFIRRFHDLHVTHLKTPAARFPGRVMRLDVRNNLTLIVRYFPDEWVLPFATDWTQRYRLIAAVNGRRLSWCAGVAGGLARLRNLESRRPVSAGTFETFARVDAIEQRMRAAKKEMNLRTLLFIDMGKNILPYWRAARRCGINVLAVSDVKLGGHDFAYRGIPILNDDKAITLRFDGAIVSNLSPVHAAQRREHWRQKTARPVIDLFEAA